MKQEKIVAALAAFTLMLTAFAVEVTKDDFKCLEGMTITSCIIDRTSHQTKVDEASSASGSLAANALSTWMESLPAIRLNTRPPSGLIITVH